MLTRTYSSCPLFFLYSGRLAYHSCSLQPHLRNMGLSVWASPLLRNSRILHPCCSPCCMEQQQQIFFHRGSKGSIPAGILRGSTVSCGPASCHACWQLFFDCNSISTGKGMVHTFRTFVSYCLFRRNDG